MSGQTNKLRKHLQSQVKSSVQNIDAPKSAQKKRPRKEELTSPAKKQKNIQEELPVDHPQSPAKSELNFKISVLEAENKRLRDEVTSKDEQIASLSKKRKSDETMEAVVMEEKRKYHEAVVEANQIRKKEKQLASELESLKQAAQQEVETYKTALKELEKAIENERHLREVQVNTSVEERAPSSGVEAESSDIVEAVPRVEKEETRDEPHTEECVKEQEPSPPQLSTPDKRNLRESTIDFSVLSSKKSEYARALEQQIQELEERKKREKKSDQVMNYFPFGKPGGGAPLVERGEVRANVTFIRSAAISPSPLKSSQ